MTIESRGLRGILDSRAAELGAADAVAKLGLFV
jgi:hypothetical protein